MQATKFSITKTFMNVWSVLLLKTVFMFYLKQKSQLVITKVLSDRTYIAFSIMDVTVLTLISCLSSLRPGLASGLEITSTGPTSIEKASGQSVKLDCQFTLGPEDSGPLDIEWSLLSSDNQKEDKVVCINVPHKP